MLEQAWAGVDIGKEHHHCVVIDAEGRRLLSRRVANDEAVLLALISDVTGLAGQVRWAVDISTGGAALLLALLVSSRPAGLLPDRAPGQPRRRRLPGFGQDRRQRRRVIADQARMRRDLAPSASGDEIVVELRML